MVVSRAPSPSAAMVFAGHKPPPDTVLAYEDEIPPMTRMIVVVGSPDKTVVFKPGLPDAKDISSAFGVKVDSVTTFTPPSEFTHTHTPAAVGFHAPVPIPIGPGATSSSA
jgi:hypothetical protein